MNKIIQFPDFRLDEDIRSIVYRYHVRSLNSNIVQTMVDLFNLKTSNTVTPRAINYFSKYLPNDTHEAKIEFLYNHTWFGILSSFHDSEFLECIFNGNDKTNNDNWVSGVSIQVLARTLSEFISEQIMYCPLCMHEDVQSFGECFVHRGHQLKFLDVCTIHNCELISRCPTCWEPLATPVYMTLLPYCRHGHEIKKQDVIQIKSYDFRKYVLINTLKLNDFGKQRDDNYTRFQLISQLGAKGYIHGQSGFLLREKLINDFFYKYGEGNLRLVGISVSMMHARLGNDLIKKFRHQYIFYGLLIDFLASDIDSFFYCKDSWSVKLPFGNSPWDCLNRFCNYYNKRIIKNYSCKYSNNGRISAEFTCPECGYIYARLWSSSTNTNKGKVAIVTVGPLTIIKLLEYCLQKKSINQLKEIISYSKSINKYLKVLFGEYNYLHVEPEVILNKIDVLREFVKNIKKYLAKGEYSSQYAKVLNLPAFKQTNIIINEDKKLAYRSKLQKIILALGDVPRSHIENMAKSEYTWLFNNDRAWIENNLPLPKNKIYTRKLDFALLDHELCEKLEKVSRVLYSSKAQKKIITKYTIINALDKSDKNRIVPYLNKGKLPMCLELLNELKETEEEYLIRMRTPKLVLSLLRNGYRNVTFESLCNKQTINKYYQNIDIDLKNKIIDIIDRIMKEYNEALEINK
ncbi:TnsD family Tn7-like transposition protein [Paenibacillus roseipurpureus]|uniref:TnsD family Tn7-like transposition protein n=1 Tax=Paenibacillus roseopurpureus TaxID=2918901 RepID=A0AA96RKZ5_9BACL|nr:TnsD family Tn7-like transposition protein [Paenibacillus sp. MBLB1832]WNR45230.1 TnsD family Tn7-like transposition protein [Paenibacillus sp. MBLB1832]